MRDPGSLLESLEARAEAEAGDMDLRRLLRSAATTIARLRTDARYLPAVIDTLSDATGEGPDQPDTTIVEQIRASVAGRTPEGQS